jgi:photosystem II stability/assembly factor-like uncharacterized protein
VLAVLPALLPVPVVAQPAGSAGAPTPNVRITTQTSGTSALLQAVHAASSQVVWAVGHRGVVLRSTNGGDRWDRRPIPSGDSLEFRDVHAINADTAWILSAGNGTASRIYRTTNGGASWTRQFMNTDTAAFYDCLSFGTGPARTGIAFSDASGARTNILYTDTDGFASAGDVVKMAGAVLEPEDVAEEVAQAIEEERFLILPHDEVVTYMATRATQHERWLRGMRRLQSRVFKTATGQ